ncbi:MAG: hypothetical protein K8T89_26010, partial [Planctomycetes bacterium]|nr:hypothetical protein [Planctomycetota bacterium]
FLLTTTLTISLFTLSAKPANAYWNSPQNNHGYGWFLGHAMNCMPSLHFHGPLYSYGPYTGPGYQTMYIPGAHWGSYVPAYPPAYYGMQGFPNSWNQSNPAYYVPQGGPGGGQAVNPYYPQAQFQANGNTPQGAYYANGYPAQAPYPANGYPVRPANPVHVNIQPNEPPLLIPSSAQRPQAPALLPNPVVAQPIPVTPLPTTTISANDYYGNRAPAFIGAIRARRNQ